MGGRLATDRLYDDDGLPTPHFNESVHLWLNGTRRLREHQPVTAFPPLRDKYQVLVDALIQGGMSRADAHKQLLSNLTTMMFGVDLSKFLSDRLSGDLVNDSGFRTTLAQGIAKNNGENFVNASVLALSDLLKWQDRVLVDKGTPRPLKKALTLTRQLALPSGSQQFSIPIECDFAVFDRYNPKKSIICSAKTRLKEVFHIGTMWKLFFDMIGDPYCMKKWGISSEGALPDVHYVFATADMIPKGGRRTQGPDVERDSPRNLIAADASFFDYVFVSKSGIGHVSRELNPMGRREALFHEFGCIIDLISQKFKLRFE